MQKILGSRNGFSQKIGVIFVMKSREIPGCCLLRKVKVERRPTHRIGVFSSHTRSLDYQLFVTQLHPIEPSNCLTKKKKITSLTATRQTTQATISKQRNTLIPDQWRWRLHIRKRRNLLTVTWHCPSLDWTLWEAQMMSRAPLPAKKSQTSRCETEYSLWTCSKLLSEF